MFVLLGVGLVVVLFLYYQPTYNSDDDRERKRSKNQQLPHSRPDSEGRATNFLTLDADTVQCRQLRLVDPDAPSTTTTLHPNEAFRSRESLGSFEPLAITAFETQTVFTVPDGIHEGQLLTLVNASPLTPQQRDLFTYRMRLIQQRAVEINAGRRRNVTAREILDDFAELPTLHLSPSNFWRDTRAGVALPSVLELPPGASFPCIWTQGVWFPKMPKFFVKP